MSIFSYLYKGQNNASASVAKERLQIIVAHERTKRNGLDFLPQMQEEILKVIQKYIQIDIDDMSVHLDNNDDCSVLELNINLPEQQDS